MKKEMVYGSKLRQELENRMSPKAYAYWSGMSRDFKDEIAGVALDEGIEEAVSLVEQLSDESSMQCQD